MKRKIFGIVLAATALLAVGCEKKEEKKEEDKTPKIICKASEEIEGIKSDSVTTITLMNDKKYVREYISEVTIVVSDESMYNLYKSAMQEDDDEKDEDVETKFDFDDANKTIKTTIKATVTDERFNKATDEEKKEFEAKSLIEEAEKSEVKCEFKNVTRGEIGL